MIGYPIDSFQDHLTQFYHWLPNGLERSQLCTQYKESGHMVLKGVIWGHNAKSRHMVFNGIDWVHNDKIRSNGLETSQLVTQ